MKELKLIKIMTLLFLFPLNMRTLHSTLELLLFCAHVSGHIREFVQLNFCGNKRLIFFFKFELRRFIRSKKEEKGF